jgi:hypothetical protein
VDRTQQPVKVVDRRLIVGADRLRERHTTVVAEQAVITFDVDDDGVDLRRLEQVVHRLAVVVAADREVRHVRRPHFERLQLDVETGLLGQVDLAASVAGHKHRHFAAGRASLERVTALVVAGQDLVTHRDARVRDSRSRVRVDDSPGQFGLQRDAHDRIATKGHVRWRVAVRADRKALAITHWCNALHARPDGLGGQPAHERCGDRGSGVGIHGRDLDADRVESETDLVERGAQSLAPGAIAGRVGGEDFGRLHARQDEAAVTIGRRV